MSDVRVVRSRVKGVSLRNAIAAVIAETARRKAEKNTCPVERDGCGEPDALLSLTFNGVCVGKLCRHCLWCSLTAPKSTLARKPRENWRNRALAAEAGEKLAAEMIRREHPELERQRKRKQKAKRR